MAELTGDWSDQTPAIIEQVLQKMQRSNPFVDRIELNQLLLSAFALLLVVAWIVLFAAEVTSRLSTFFLLSGSAAALGSTFRSIVSCHFNVETRFVLGRFLTELVLGVIIAFLLFLLLQLGNVVVSGTTMALSFTDAEQFQRLAVTMSLVAFAGAYLIERALERLRGRLIGLLDEASTTTRERH